MSKDLEKAFLEQGRRLFELCRLYIDGGLNPEEKDSLTKEIEDAFDKWDEIDNRALFDEITANLEEPMSEQHRKRYCFSLITPFGEYSSTTTPKWLIGKMQESIDSWQGDESARYKIETYKKQIEKANKKADKYLDIIKPTQRGEVANVLCEFAQIVYEYGILLDAAFVVHGLDLKRLQDKCGVWIKQDWQHELRVLDIGHYVGSEALAEEYLSRLPQEQPEPQQKDLHYYCQKAIEKGYLKKVADGYRRNEKEWTKAQLAYFLEHFPNADGTFPDKEYSIMFGESRLGKARSQLANNINGDGKPRGYKIVNRLLQE